MPFTTTIRYPLSMRKASFLSILLIILLTSCTVSEQITLNNKTNSKIESDIQVEDFFVTVIEDFASFLPTSDESLLDGGIKGFSNQLKSSSATTAVSYSKPEENHYLIDVSFSSLPQLINDLSGGIDQSIIKLDDNSFSFYVDINNYNELEQIVPFLADPNFETFLPQYNIGYTEEDYLDMIVFLLGEEAPEKIKESTIKIRLKTPSRITSYTNCKKINSTTIEYEFELIDFLLLATPLSFSVKW